MSQRFYTWWGSSAHYNKSAYWTCVSAQCRLAATLEGRTLYQNDTGENPDSTCQVCQKLLKGVYETERTQESRERLATLPEGVAQA